MVVEAVNRIWDKVFEHSGETGADGKLERCPGESCKQFASRFLKVKGTWKQKAEEAVSGCGKCDGVPPLEPATQTSTDEVSELVDEIEDIVLWENAGHKIEWTVYPFEFQLLHRYWRQAEMQVKEISEIRMQAFLKGWMTE